MSLDLNLALALFLGATWVGLLNSIIDTTRERPAEHTLFAIAFVHFVVLVYFLLAASVLYGKAVKAVIGREWSRMTDYEEIFVVTWPAAAVGAVFGFLAIKLTGFYDPLIAIIPFTIFVLCLLIWAKKSRHLIFFLVTLGLFFPYVWLMSLCWSGVSVNTNDAYYKQGDTAIITAKSEGYLFNPSINKVEIWSGSYPSYEVPSNVRTGYIRMVQKITDDMAMDSVATGPVYIRVIYTPQAWWFSREEYKEIVIIPR
jgi:hypothetical protein